MSKATPIPVRHYRLKALVPQHRMHLPTGRTEFPSLEIGQEFCGVPLFKGSAVLQFYSVAPPPVYLHKPDSTFPTWRTPLFAVLDIRVPDYFEDLGLVEIVPDFTPIQVEA